MGFSVGQLLVDCLMVISENEQLKTTADNIRLHKENISNHFVICDDKYGWNHIMQALNKCHLVVNLTLKMESKLNSYFVDDVIIRETDRTLRSVYRKPSWNGSY